MNDNGTEKDLLIRSIRDKGCTCTARTVCKGCAVRRRYIGKYTTAWAEAVRAHNDKEGKP